MQNSLVSKSAIDQHGNDLSVQTQGHLRMISGHVVWCDRCGSYGTHRGCGLARPCPGHATMGAGGGKWQRLLLLREGRHPKDKTWLGTPIPEAHWSMATVSQVGIALSETRKRDNLVAQKSAPPFSSAIKLSRLEMVRRRVRAKECAERGRVVVENKIADMSAHQVSGNNTCKLSNLYPPGIEPGSQR